jgi:hypothetical protein
LLSDYATVKGIVDHCTYLCQFSIIYFLFPEVKKELQGYHSKTDELRNTKVCAQKDHQTSDSLKNKLG